MVQNEAATFEGHHKSLEAKLTAALASCNQAQASLRIQLRTQSADVDHLEAVHAGQRAIIKTLRIEIARVNTAHKEDAHDLLHLAGRLLALADAAGVELDATTKALFRRRGWTAAARKTEARQ